MKLYREKEVVDIEFTRRKADPKMIKMQMTLDG